MSTFSVRQGLLRFVSSSAFTLKSHNQDTSHRCLCLCGVCVTFTTGNPSQQNDMAKGSKCAVKMSARLKTNNHEIESKVLYSILFKNWIIIGPLGVQVLRKDLMMEEKNLMRHRGQHVLVGHPGTLPCSLGTDCSQVPFGSWVQLLYRQPSLLLTNKNDTLQGLGGWVGYVQWW